MLKRKRTVEERTVFVLSCDGLYALEKRPSKGLLADLWQFPNVLGKMSVDQAVGEMENIGLKPKELLRTVERKHIFTHIEWLMCGVYVEVKDVCPVFTWMTAEQIEKDAALPTAFRQFWDEILVK